MSDDTRNLVRSRRRLVAVTALLGLLSALTVPLATPALERTFGALSAPVQLLMSVTLPFLGVLTASDVVRHRRAGTRGPAGSGSLLPAFVLAAGFAGFGLLLTTIGVALTPSHAPGGRWEHAGAAAAGAVLVQLVAQATGTGWGLLLPNRRVVACLATIVVPLGAWGLLGLVDVLRPLRDWVTPFGTASHLLAGDMTLLNGVQEIVVVAIWVVGLNLAGRRRSLS